MNETLTTQIWNNLRLAVKQISSYVVLLATSAAGWWLLQSADQQAKFIADHPMLAQYGPYLTVAAWAVAKVWPQKAVTNELAAQGKIDPPPPEKL